MTDEAHQIHEEAPTDAEGHPIHPERGHRICGAEKSDRTTPTEHGRERDEYAYCLQPAGWGTEGEYGACSNHPYKGSQIGTSNPNHCTGAYSDHMQSDLTPDEQDAYEELVDALEDPDHALDAIRELAAEALLKYKRSADQRFLREFRQLADTFNLAPNSDQMEVEHSGEVDTELSVPDHVSEAIATAAESNLESGDS